MTEFKTRMRDLQTEYAHGQNYPPAERSYDTIDIQLPKDRLSEILIKIVRLNEIGPVRSLNLL